MHKKFRRYVRVQAHRHTDMLIAIQRFLTATGGGIVNTPWFKLQVCERLWFWLLIKLNIEAIIVRGIAPGKDDGLLTPNVATHVAVRCSASSHPVWTSSPWSMQKRLSRSKGRLWHILGLPCRPNLSLMARFADINVSQGGVATHARCGGMFNMHLTTNLLRNLQWKKIANRLVIWQNYGHESVVLFLVHPVYAAKR